MKKLLVIGALLGMVYGSWRLVHSPAPTDGAGQELAFDRLWIDHLPRNDRDAFHLFVAVTEQPVGIFDLRSQWKGAWELFRYEPRGDGQVQLLFPQTGTREAARYRATTCRERGFDYCLELSGSSRGVQRYYSRKGWEVDSKQDAARLGSQVDALVKTLPTDGE